MTTSNSSSNTLTLDQALQQAVTRHKAGDLNGAEQLYRTILQTNPRHPDANHNLGVLAVQVQKPSVALPFFKTALEVNQGQQQYWLSYIDALIKTGQPDAARQMIKQARKQGLPEKKLKALERQLDAGLNPVRVEEPLPAEIEQLATAFNQCRYAEAEFLALKMTERLPNHGFAWKALGALYQQQGNLFKSLMPHQKAIELTPGDAEVHNNLGNALKDLGRLEEAEASYRRALKIRPDYAEAYSNLGSVITNLGRLEEAEASFRRALELKPHLTEVYNFLGNNLKDQGRTDEALANYRLFLDDKVNIQEALRHLTKPLVSCTGMVLASPEAGSRVTSANQHPPSLDLQEVRPSEYKTRKKLRIALIYPPPWQIPSHDDTSCPGMPFGPPRERNEHGLDGDFQTISYGLLTIAAQARRAGYDVTVYNLSVSPWQDVVKLIGKTEADLYGISAFTANRRGMGAVAALIRKHRPQAHITVGGPFVTALPLETLHYYKEIDTAVIGEGEDTFMDILTCLESGKPVVNVPGTAWRDGNEVILGAKRPRIDDLDALASPFDYFTSHIVMTSRGCPSKCTFCGSFTTWGKKLRFHSANACLDIFRKSLARLPMPFIAIKDDTFTANRQRAIEICDAIIENKLNFIWNCDSRVDALDDELLRKMRLAGCQMISFGVESGSPAMLKNMHKKTTPEMILKTTRTARKYGMCVRYYMILCNQGETTETIQQSIDLIKDGRPEHFLFNALSFYPGTENWTMLAELQGLSPDIFFKNDFKELSIATNRHKELQEVFLHILCSIDAFTGFRYTVEEREAVVGLLPNVHSVHLELANAYLRANRFDAADSALNRAQESGFPVLPVIDNQRACIALAKGDTDNAYTLLGYAIQSCPHGIVMKNYKKLQAWFKAPVNSRCKPPVLDDSVQLLDFMPENLFYGDKIL